MIAEARSSVNAPTVSVVLMILNEFKGDASEVSTSALVIGISTGPYCVIGCPQASSRFGSTYVTVQVPAIDRSPRTRTALTALPGTRGSGCTAFGSAPPRPATGVNPIARNLSPNRSTVSWLNPPNISGVSIARISGDPSTPVLFASARCIPTEAPPFPSRTCSIDSIGVIPAIGSLVNCPIR